MRLLLLVLVLLVGTAAAHPVDGGWHRSDEPADTNTTLIPQITTRTVTHYHPMSELSEAERSLLVTPTPAVVKPPAPVIVATEQGTPVSPNATFVWGVVAVTALIGVVLLLRYRRQHDGK